MRDLAVIIPTYNSAPYVIECLESVKRINPGEVIVVDDGSSDDTELIVHKWCETFEGNVRFTKTNHLGVSAARNKGMELVSKQFLMFVDADDLLNEEVVDKFCALHLRQDIDLISISANGRTGIAEVDNRNKLDFQRSLTGLVEYQGLITAVFSKIYTVQYLRRHNIRFNENIEKAEDALFNMQVIQCNPKISFEKMPLYLYRKNQQSITRSYSYHIARNYELTHNEILEFFLHKGSSVEVKTILANWLIRDFKNLKSSDQNYSTSILNMLQVYRKTVKNPLTIKWKSFRPRQRGVYLLLCLGFIELAYIFDNIQIKPAQKSVSVEFYKL